MLINNVPLIPSLGFIAPALRRITIHTTRNGQLTADYKEAVLWASIYTRATLLYFTFKDGKTKTETVVASAIDGLKAVMLYDFDAQPYAAVHTQNITADIVLNIDLNNGTGGGGSPGDQATTDAVVRVNKQPASREIVAIERTSTGQWRLAGNKILQAGVLEVQVTGGQVFAVGLDDYGVAFQSGLSIKLGQTVRPSNFQGWLYRCTEVGILPVVEPDWWVEEGENPPRLVGTARLQAVRYYQPIAHGPIHYELI